MRKSRLEDTLRSLESFSAKTLSETNQLNLRLFTQLTRNELEISQYNRHLLPFSHRGGIQLAHEDSEVIPLKSFDNYYFWIQRLRNLDKRIEQTIALAKLGLQKGYKPPKILMERVNRQINLQSHSKVKDSPFYKVFIDLPESISKEDQTSLRMEAEEVIKETVIPSYLLLEKYFKEEYLLQSRESVGLYDIPNGRELYEALTKSFTTTDLSPKEIHQIGLKEVKRIRSRLQTKTL